MKNVRENQLKKCIFMELDEFISLVERLTDGLQTVEYEDGVYLISTDKADETDTYWNEGITETLSKYFGVEVTSFHSDNCEYVGVWICYKEMDEEYKQKCKELKRKCFDLGADAIEDLLGVSLEFETDKAMFEFADDILAQMPDEEFEMLYDRYCGNKQMKE